MNEHITNLIAGLAAAAAAAFFALEVARRRRQLRALYHVLGKEDRHICVALEQMVGNGSLKPWKPGSELP